MQIKRAFLSSRRTGGFRSPCTFGVGAAREGILAGYVVAVAQKHHRYLKDEFFGLVLSATVQRAGIYSPEASEADRELFRVGLRNALQRIAGQYKKAVSDDVHFGNVEALANRMSADHAKALRDKRFRIGPAQKALNLYLKYEWCAGWIPTPPHCPFDALILQKLPSLQNVRWTHLDSIDEYRQIVTAARSHAKGVCLADWELELYDQRSAGSRRSVAG